MFIFCVSQDICYILTINRKYREVELLLSCDLLKRLYPVLLLKVLNDCPQEEIPLHENCNNGIFICESIKFLLEKSHFDLRNDYDLNKLHVLLKNHIRIVEYIFDWKRRYITRTQSNAKELKNMQSDVFKQTVSVTQILSLLQKHSVLSVLKMTTNIHEQDHNAIHNLLTESGESANFQAYCSIVSALKAILLCEFYSMEHKQIAKYFTDMVSYLSSLFPLSLRIEMIKNIFSLLFLRYEDFNVTSSKEDNCGVSLERTDISESMEYERIGFICNKYAIRDMMHYLWESISSVTQEIGKLQLLEEQTEMQQLRENMSALTSALMNAQWRLKFYMKLNFTENIGIPQDESHDSSVTSKSELALSRKPNFPHRFKDETFFYKGDSNSDEIRVKSDSSSESGLLGGNPKRRKRSRNAMATADPSMTKGKPSLINFMLASKESLVLHCLWKSDLQKAQEVVEVILYSVH